MNRLNREFYERDGLTVAQELLGKVMVREVNGEVIRVRIIETECYRGPEDKGSHAHGNRRTKRTETMFHQGGTSYVYMIYGMYYCFNVVANKKEIPHAVLIRAVEPMDGIEFIRKNRPIKSKKIQELTNGPGKVCLALSIDKYCNGLDLIESDELYIVDDRKPAGEIIAGPRINIDYAQEFKDKPWRFWVKGNRFVSK